MITYDMKAFTNQELIAMMIRENPDSQAVTDLLIQLNDPRQLLGLTMEDLIKIDGVGYKKGAQFLAGIEIGKRIFCAPPKNHITIISSPDDVAALVMPAMRYLDREHFRCMYLNRKNHFQALETVSVGGLSSSVISPRECFKPGFRLSSASVILIHNHPSGDPTPSDEDISVTKRLAEVGRLINIEVIDHLIIGDGIWVSMKSQQMY